MRFTSAMLAVLAISSSVPIHGQESSSVPIAPAVINASASKWISPPPVPGLSFAWLIGSERATDIYAIRVKLTKGAVIPPHTHPDERHSTVLAGTLYVGFGETVDHDSLVAIAQGDVYIAPAGVAHYLVAKDGNVEYQESGVGPTATRIIGLE